MSIELPVIFSLIFLLTMSYNRFITIKQTYSSWELQKGRDISMLVSTKGRYALRVMIDLAEQKSDEYIPLKAIAERQEISEKYLESIIKLLVRGKLLTGLRGKGGGYRLTRSPDQYTVGSVLRLTEESLSPVACLDTDSPSCPRAPSCRTLPLWKGLDKVINDYLDNITVADLVRQDNGGMIKR